MKEIKRLRIKGKPGPKRVSSGVPPPGTKIKIITKKIRKYERKPFGPKQKKVLTKKAKAQIVLVRKYKKLLKAKKGAYARKYNSELTKVMKKKGYFPEDIARAKKYTLTGKAVKAAIVKIPLKNIRFGKGKKVKFLVEGKGWISKKSFNRLVGTTKYWAIIKHYRELFNLTLKEARELYRALRGEFGEKIRKAIY
jgi:hypothetical protein